MLRGVPRPVRLEEVLPHPCRGLDLPFVFLRQETYVKIRIGSTYFPVGIDEEEYELGLVVNGATSIFRQPVDFHWPEMIFFMICRQSFAFHRKNPFWESLTHVMDPKEALLYINPVSKASQADNLSQTLIYP